MTERHNEGRMTFHTSMCNPILSTAQMSLIVFSSIECLDVYILPHGHELGDPSEKSCIDKGRLGKNGRWMNESSVRVVQERGHYPWCVLPSDWTFILAPGG